MRIFHPASLTPIGLSQFCSSLSSSSAEEAGEIAIKISYGTDAYYATEPSFFPASRREASSVVRPLARPPRSPLVRQRLEVVIFYCQDGRAVGRPDRCASSRWVHFPPSLIASERFPYLSSRCTPCMQNGKTRASNFRFGFVMPSSAFFAIGHKSQHINKVLSLMTQAWPRN